jgi:hypothetical protein
MLSVSVCILLKINVHALYEYVLCGYCVFLLQVVHKLLEPTGVLHRKCSPMFMTSSSIPISQEHHDSTVMLHPYSISHRVVNLLHWSHVTLLCQWHCMTNGDEWWNGTLKEETSACLISWRDEFVTLTANKYLQYPKHVRHNVKFPASEVLVPFNTCTYNICAQFLQSCS